MKHKAATFFLCDLLLVYLLSIPAVAVSGGRGALDAFCGYRCRGRCARAGYSDRCLKYCGICCRECKCVPSGTYGNKHECPCYRDKLNSKGKPKCP